MRSVIYLLLAGIAVVCLLTSGSGSQLVPTFQLGPTVQTQLDINPSGLVIGNFNRDGCLDIAVISEGPRLPRGNGSLQILQGQCDGTFQAGPVITAGQEPIDIITADFDRDGVQDVAVANRLSGTVFIATNLHTTSPKITYLYVSKTRPSKPERICDGPQALAAADFNDDDAPDLAVACFTDTRIHASSIVQIFIQDGNGKFGGPPAQELTAVDWEIGDGPISLAADDFDNDGNPDLAVANSESTSNSIAILKGTGHTQPPFLAGIITTLLLDNAPWALDHSDINRDGNPDLAVVARYSNSMRIFLGTGAGGFVEKPRLPTCSQPVSVAVGDFNADAKSDLAVACFESANVYVYQGKGDGTFNFITSITLPQGQGGSPSLSANITDVVVGKLLLGPGGDQCDDIAFLVAPNTPVPPAPGTLVVQSIECK